MIINGHENTLERILLTSQEVEDIIINHKLRFFAIRNKKIEWGMNLPMFVPVFYNLLINSNSIPSQDQFWNSYISSNGFFFNNTRLSDEQMFGLKARVFRTYPSLVRDTHFGLILKEDSFFDEVYYNEILDIEYGIDLVVMKNQRMLGLNLFTNTEAAINARNVKQFRPKKPVNFKCIEIPIDFKGSKICGDFFLYSDREINEIKQRIISCI